MSFADRFAELRGVEESKDVELAVVDSSFADHRKQYDPINEGISTVEANIQKIVQLRNAEATAVDEKVRTQIMKDLDTVMTATTAVATKTKKLMDEIKQKNDAFVQKKENQHSAEAQMRTNLFQTYMRRFHKVMNSYQQTSHQFKQALIEHNRRHLGLFAKDKLTPEQIEMVLESGQAQKVIGDALISEELDDAVREIEERHQGIVKLEQQVREIYELFRDLAFLVEMQQDTLDVIEARVLSAKNYVEQGEVELVKAEDSQRSAMSKQCKIFLLLLIIFLFAAAAVGLISF